MIDWIMQQIELQMAKNIVGHHSKSQTNKTKAMIVRKNDLKMR